MCQGSERLKYIEEQVQSAADLTKQLLGFARGGRNEIRPVDINKIIRKTSSMFRRTRKELTIQDKYERNLWTVEVDQGQIEQVLLNLYVNAWHAMPSGGELRLATENVILDEGKTMPYAIPAGDYVKIVLTVVMMALAVVVTATCFHRWAKILTCPACPSDETEPERDLMRLAEDTDVSD